jgi:hypothetical protein
VFFACFAPQDVKAGNILLSKDGKAKLGEFLSMQICLVAASFVLT